MAVSTILKAKGDQKVVTVDGHATVADVIRKLADHQIGAVVVLEKGTVSGIVSERDIVRALADPARSSMQTLSARAETIMTTPVITCRPDDTIDWIMAEMTTRRFRHFPVVENGRLLGIISIGDVVKIRMAETEMEAAAMRDYIIAR